MSNVAEETVQPRENKMGYLPIPKLLASVSLPMMISMLVLSLYNIVDSIFVGMLSENALAAVSLAFPVQILVIAVGSGTGVGVNAILSRSLGEKNFDRADKAAGNGILLALASSVLFIILGFTLVKPFFVSQTTHADPEIYTYGVQYLSVICIFSFAVFCQSMLERLLQSTGKTFYTMITQATGAIINIILDPLFIFGIGFFPKMGIAGAAIATVIAKVIELAWALLVMMKKDSVKIRLGWAIRPDKVLLRDFWKYTAPILGDELMWGLGFTMYSVIMGHMGSDAAAANSIANIVKNLVICFCTGIATASGIMVGSLLGQGELEKAKEYGRKLSKTSIFAGAVAGVIILGVIPFTPMFSTLTDTAKEYLRVMLVVCSYYVVGKSINMTVISGIFAAGGDSKFGFICDGITMWCVTVPIGLIAAFVLKLPVLTVYILINVDEIIKLPAVLKNYRKYRWVKNLTRQETAPVEPETMAQTAA